MESGIVTSYKNKGIIIAFLFEVFKYLLKKLFFRQIFLKSIYFSSCKNPENQESASLMVTNKVISYTDHTMTPCIQKVFIATYICIWSTMYNHYAYSHICYLWLDKGPYLIFGNKGKFVAWTLHRFYVLKLIHPLLYDDDTITHAVNDLSNSWIKDTRWKVMIILGYWTLHHFHTQTLLSLHLDWWYFLRCGNDFSRITLIFWSKYDR